MTTKYYVFQFRGAEIDDFGEIVPLQLQWTFAPTCKYEWMDKLHIEIGTPDFKEFWKADSNYVPDLGKVLEKIQTYMAQFTDKPGAQVYEFRLVQVEAQPIEWRHKYERNE